MRFGGAGGIRITQRKTQSAQYVENRHFQAMEQEDFILVSPLFPSNLFLIVVKTVVRCSIELFFYNTLLRIL